MVTLEVKDLTKYYNKNLIFSKFSFSAKQGEVVSITGPSGIGKSTLLRIINRLEDFDEGNIQICGSRLVKRYEKNKKIYNDKDILKQMNLNVGIVFQEFNLFPHLSVIENITISLKRNLKLDKKEANEKALKLLRTMNIENKANNYPFELSGGQKQRVAIARTLAVEPKIVCFDEPTSSLDDVSIIEVVKIIKKLALEGITIIIVTHDMDFAGSVSDRIINIENIQ